MKKLIAETLQEYRDEQIVLNEEQINESIADQYNQLNKNDEAAVRNFVKALALKKYVAAKGASTDAAKKLIENLAAKTPVDQLKKFLEEAAADKFAGRTIFVYADPQAKTGRLLAWKKAADLNLASQFKSGGTGGQTGQGGV